MRLSVSPHAGSSDASNEPREAASGPLLHSVAGLFDVPRHRCYFHFFEVSPPLLALPAPPCSKTARKSAAVAAFSADLCAKRAAVLAEYQEGKSSVRDLADKFDMSKSAVSRLVSGETSAGSKRGRQTILPPEIEEKVVKGLIRCAEAHVGLDPNAMRRAVGYYLTKAGLAEDDYEMGAGWYESFMNRHKHQLSSLKGRSISKSRSFGFNRVAVDDWTNFVGPIAKRFKAAETNTDDTGINLEVLEDGRVVGPRGGGQPQVRVEETKLGHISVTLCAPAEGAPLPLLFCFKGERADFNYAHDSRLGDAFIMTSKGWATTGTYFKFAQMFIEHMKKNGIAKALLYSDNADIHINQEINEMLVKASVTAVGLMRAATHKHQPLDIGGIQNIKKKMRPWAKKNRVPYKKENVMQIFGAAFDEVIKARRQEGKSFLQLAFLRTGLWPWNPSIFSDVDFAASDAYFGLDDPAERERARSATKKRWDALSAIDPLVAFSEFDPKTRDALGEGAAAAKAKRLSTLMAKLPGAKDAEGRLDAVEAAADRVWTSPQFTEHAVAKAARKAVENKARADAAAASAVAAAERSRALAEKRAQRAAMQAANAEKKRQKTEAVQARKAAREAAAVAEAARKAASKAARPAESAMPQARPEAPPQARKRARAEPEDGDQYAKQYNKKARAT